MARIRVIQEYWYDNPGCSCCEPTPMEYWTLHDTEDEEASFNNGTPHDMDGVLQALEEMKIGMEDVEFCYNEPVGAYR